MSERAGQQGAQRERVNQSGHGLIHHLGHGGRGSRRRSRPPTATTAAHPAQYGSRASSGERTNSSVTMSKQQRLDQRGRLHEPLQRLQQIRAQRTARRREPPR